MILMGWSNIPKVPKFPMPLKYLKEEVRDDVDFLHADKYQSFLQVDSSTLIIKVSYKVILSLLMGMTKHYQSTQSNKFVTSIQYLKKEVRNGVHFLQADKHQRFYKLTLLFLMEVTRHVQSPQQRINREQRKFAIFLQYIKKKVLQLLLCSIVMQKLWGSNHARCYR